MNTANCRFRGYIAIFLLTLVIITFSAVTSEAKKIPDLKAYGITILDGNREVTELVKGEKYKIVFQAKKEVAGAGSVGRTDVSAIIQIGGTTVPLGYKTFLNKSMKKYKQNHRFEVLGDFTLVAKVDAENVITESNETNNTSSIRVTVIDASAAPINDLKAQTLDITAGGRSSTNIEVGQPLSIDFGAQNTTGYILQNVKMNIEITGPQRSFDSTTKTFAPQATQHYKINKTLTKEGNYTIQGFCGWFRHSG